MLRTHQLIKKTIDGKLKNYCTLCQQNWQGKPRKPCPGAKLVKYSYELESKYKPEDWVKRDNLRLTDVVCCYEKDKEYVYLYAPDGATELWYPDLPTILDDLSYAQKLEFSLPGFDNQLCLKNEIGLKSLNLKPTGSPVCCYWASYMWGEGDFELLYNPLDCQILDPALPPRFERPQSLTAKYPQAVVEYKLPSMNLQPKQNATAIGVVWNSKNWNYYYLPEDCELINPDLPPIYQYRSDVTRKHPDAVLASNLVRYNLKPKSDATAVGVIWNNKGWDYYYLSEDCKVSNPNLPPVYSKIPQGLYLARELKLFNRQPGKATPRGVIWNFTHNRFDYLYSPSECESANSNLPQIYLRSRQLRGECPAGFELVPDGLKSAYIWSQINPLQQVRQGAAAKGCYWDGDIYVNVYGREDLELHDRDIYLSKTKLKQIFHLPPSLIKQLGKPDRYDENPVNAYYPPVHQYKRSRVERFLADNAEIYAKHLARYDRYLAIFNANKEKLAAGKARSEKIKREIGRKGQKLLAQFDWNVKSDVAIAQCKKCLTCASSYASPEGFLCAINPYGFDLAAAPCHDWREK